MKDIKRLSWMALTSFVIALIVLSLGSWAEDSSDSRSLVLDVYADDAGKALVTGYANGIEGLPFLNASEYIYDNDSLQLYAVTNSLTSKSGDEWEIRLPAEGVYDEYHATFYLSGDVQLSNITGTAGLDYLVSSSSDSFVVEFHGYDVTSPTAVVRYRQPLNGDEVEAGAEAEGSALQQEKSSSVPILLAVGLIVALIVVAAFKLGRSGKSGQPQRRSQESEAEAVTDLQKEGFEEDRENLADLVLAETPPSITSEGEMTSSKPDAGEAFVPSEDEVPSVPSDGEPGRSVDETPSAPPGDEVTSDAEATSAVSDAEKGGSTISAEMMAVMETLTERERSVLEALIKHEGKMTQADIRYETGIPKSSLTGIIISLERRNIVTKKEWGRTNVIELSDRLRERDDDQRY
jgi:uncharacterized membrane protein